MPATDTLPRRVRVGYGSGSVATGAFGTVPGLMLLPYLTDSLGIAALLPGCIVFAAEGVGRDAQPDRRPDQRPHASTRAVRGGRGCCAPGCRWRSASRCSSRRPRSATAARGAAGCWCVFLACATAYAFFQVPYVAMPAEITDVLRRAHPADDLAGRDPGVHDHARRRDRAGDPRRRRRPRRATG